MILAWPQSPVLAWEIIVTEQMSGIPVEQQVYVDATTGSLIATSEGGIVAGHYASARSPVTPDAAGRYRTAEGTGNGYYNGTVKITTARSGDAFWLVDPTRPGLSCAGPDGQPYTGPVNTWGTSRGDDLVAACVDLMYGAQREWDMLAGWFGRDGFDGYGHATPIQVGLPDESAVWTPRLSRYGRTTTATGTRQLAAIDVVGHEFGHAVFEYTPGSSGSARDPENGILNEEVADMFAVMTDAFANNPKDPPDYTIGETVSLGDKGPIRIMYQPSLVAGFADCYPPRQTAGGCSEIPLGDEAVEVDGPVAGEAAFLDVADTIVHGLDQGSIEVLDGVPEGRRTSRDPVCPDQRIVTSSSLLEALGRPAASRRGPSTATSQLAPPDPSGRCASSGISCAATRDQ